MAFKEIIETAQATALADKLYPDELAVWHKACRQYSEKFSESLSKVLTYDVEFVFYHLYASKIGEMDQEEHFEDILDMLGSLSDPEYDIKRERESREQDRKMIEEEKQRIKEGRTIHSSIIKDKSKTTKEESKKELPKSGGINMDIINKLNSEDQGKNNF